MYIILLGAPGSGKGTQAINIAQKLNLVHVATGDLLRQAIAQGTELGMRAKVYLDEGALASDEITIEMVLERLVAPDCQPGVVLDGFPRNMVQAKALDEALVNKNKAIDKVVYIKVSEDELMKRLSGRWICRNCQIPYHAIKSPPKVQNKCDRCGDELYQRPDDNVETVKKRLKVYISETAPLIDYYTGAGKLVEIAGEGDIDEVSTRIVTALGGVSGVR